MQKAQVMPHKIFNIKSTSRGVDSESDASGKLEEISEDWSSPNNEKCISIQVIALNIRSNIFKYNFYESLVGSIYY